MTKGNIRFRKDERQHDASAHRIAFRLFVWGTERNVYSGNKWFYNESRGQSDRTSYFTWVLAQRVTKKREPLRKNVTQWLSMQCLGCSLVTLMKRYRVFFVHNLIRLGVLFLSLQYPNCSEVGEPSVLMNEGPTSPFCFREVECLYFKPIFIAVDNTGDMFKGNIPACIGNHVFIPFGHIFWCKHS